MENAYLWFKALHLISVISWMAGLLYLPRIYVYHCAATPGSEQDQTFKTMERKLLRYIMNPAMIATFLFGGILIMIIAVNGMPKWLHVKLGLVLIMAAFHMMLAKYRKDFEIGQHKKSARFFKMINEIPTVLMIVIIILAVVKPF
ncbi:MAG: protoporphyrinogen oxidase HemJ [Alphaproteobacteria bacterium]|nr:protoporphyrinogen oxidase HemJ [Alphaproteobacteria bacterium]